jgi:hypothetical protein
MRRQDEGGEPSYTQITNEGLAAVLAVAKRVRPTAPLALRARKLLRALKARRATNQQMAAKKQVIAIKAGVGNYKTRSVQDAFDDLHWRGLIISKKRAGTWLTPAGLAAVTRRRDDVNK